jgi:VanZ family protein
MRTDGRRAKAAAFSAVFRRAGLAILAAAYAAALVAATHIPRPERLVGRFGHADKALHFVAYLLLAAFVTAAVRAAGWRSWRVAIGVALGLAAFGVADELTQPLFGRRAELLDWAADCAGIALGMAIVAIASSGSGRGSRRA